MTAYVHSSSPDSTLAALKASYRRTGLLAAGEGLPHDVAFSLDDAEQILGWDCYDHDRIGIDLETPAPSAEALARLLAAMQAGLIWRAPEIQD